MADRNLTGTVLKLRYGITTRVSERGAAAVYLGSDEDEEKPVVVRVPNEDLLDDDEFMARFLDASHVPEGIPGLPAVLELGREKNLAYAVVEFVDGKTVEDLAALAGGRLSAEDTLHWLRAAGRTLELLHAAGSTHRAVSPRSILVGDDESVHLTDVAIASALPAAAAPPELLDPTAQSAPEISAQGFTPAADQFSLAATVATSVMGKDFLARQARKGMQHALETRMPAGAAEALVKALDPEPDGRFGGVEAFVAAFEEAIGTAPLAAPLGEGTATMLLEDAKEEVAAILEEARLTDDEEPVPLVVPVSEAPAPPPRASRRWGPLVGGLVAVLLVVGGWFLFGGGGKKDPDPETPPRVEKPKPEPESKPEFTARLELDREGVPEMTASESLDVTGRLVDAGGGWIEVAGRRIDPDAAGAFRASVALTEGDNEIEIRFFDGEGRSGPPAEIDVERDSRPPLVTVSSPRPDFVTGEATVIVTGRVEDAHPRAVRVGDFTVPVNEDGTFRAEVSLAREGTNRLEIRGVDQLGNESRPLPLTVVLDSKGPEIKLESPAEGAVTREERIQVRGRVAEPHLDRVRVNDRVVDVGADGTFETEVDLAEGESTIRIVATDKYGHDTRADRHVERDATGPAITVSSPGDGTTTGEETVTVKGRIQDPHPGKVVINGIAVVPDASGWFEVDIKLEAGPNEIRIVASDALGNEANPVIVRVVVDRSGPDVTAEVPEKTTLAEIEVVGTVSEDGCVVRVQGEDALVTGREFRASVKLDVGENAIEIEVRDRVGNVTTKVSLVTRLEPGPSPDVPHLTVAGPDTRLNREPVPRVPAGLEAGDIVTGPATIVTPAKDTLEVQAGATLEVRPTDRGVTVFFVRSGTVKGRIRNTTSVGIPFGWLVVPRGVVTAFSAATVSPREARVRLEDGRGGVLYGDYSIILAEDQSVRVFKAKSGDLAYRIPSRNAKEVMIRNHAAPSLDIFVRVPPGFSGTIEQLKGGEETKLAFETSALTGKMPFIWTKVGGKTIEESYAYPDQVCLVDKADDLGELSFEKR